MGNESFTKRQRERARQDKQRAKAADREVRKQNKALKPDSATGEDPDIAGIIPGPQPSPWGDDDLIADDTEDEVENAARVNGGSQ